MKNQSNAPSVLKNSRLLTFSTLALASSALFLAQAQAQAPVSAPASPAIQRPNAASTAPVGQLPIDLIMQVRQGADVRVMQGVVGRDRTLVSIPFKYRRTAVLTKDWMGNGLFGGRGLVLKAGAKGYWAGRFTSTQYTQYGYGPRIAGPTSFTEIWCFFGENAGGRPARQCVQLVADGTAQRLDTITPPYLLTSFSSSPNTFPIDRPDMEEREVEVFNDLRLEYRFREWDDKDVDVLMVVNNEVIENYPAPRSADGSAAYPTPAGVMRLRQQGNDRRSALVTLEQRATPSVASPATDAGTGTTNEAKEAAARAIPMDRLALMLDQLANDVENRSRNRSTKTPLMMTFMSRPAGETQPRRIARGDTIARQTMRQTKGFTQNASPQGRPDRFGPAGAVLVEVQPAGFTGSILCWRDLASLEKRTVAYNVNVDGHCLQDRNRDGNYEVLWKDISWVTGSALSVQSLATSANLGEGNSPFVTVSPADPSIIPPETIELVYLGVVGEALNTAGQIEPKAIGFEWRFATVKGESYDPSQTLARIVLPVTPTRTATRLAPNGTKLIDVSGIEPSGGANIVFNGGFELGEQAITEPSDETQIANARIALIRQKASEARAGKQVDVVALLKELSD